jgi:hypothetical protein
MISDAPRHDIDDALSALRRLTPDATQAARVRARCHAQLARGQRHADSVRVLARGVVAPAVVLGVCGAYVISLVAAAWRIMVW